MPAGLAIYARTELGETAKSLIGLASPTGFEPVFSP